MLELNPDIEDVELIKRLRKGDIAAFDAIYQKYSGRLFNFGLKLLRSEAETEELIQSVFMKLWENHRNLKPELSFKSYLYTIAYNDICKLFRQRNYMRKFIDYHVSEESGIFSDLGERLDYKSLLEHVRKVINKLPEKQKAIFIKSREEGKSTREIAVEMGLSPGTVDNYISESLKFIRKNISEKDLLYFLVLVNLSGIF